MEIASSISSCCSYISSAAVILILVFPNLIPKGETQDRIRRFRKRARNFANDRGDDDTSEGGKRSESDTSLD